VSHASASRRYPRCGVCLAIVLSPIMIGCAGQPARPQVSLESIKLQQVKLVTAECFARNDGLRFVYGDQAISVACRRWAADQVR
jgi:hypothetical protein